MKPKIKKHRASRTRFAKDIVCEFLQPIRKSDKVVIVASGAPVMPGVAIKTLQFFAKQGYWVFFPRYRGTWESDGSFLEISPDKDLTDVMDGIASGFMNLETGEKVRIRNPKFYLLGGSFGGPAILLASKDKRVRKAVVLSPVIDWTKQGNTSEPLELMAKVLPLVWGQAYRGNPNVWKKLAKGNFYSPWHEMKNMNGKKLLVIHAKDDEVVPFAPAEAFAKATKSSFVAFRTGGHFGLRSFPKARFWRHVSPFLKKS